MDKAKDFTGDLAELEASIDVSDVLTALKQSQQGTPKPSSSTMKPKAEATLKPVRSTPTKTAAETPGRGLSKTAPKAPSTFVNVTTKLTPETKQRLRQAARLQDAYGREPATEYAIVNQAVEEWLKRHGYARRLKGEDAGDAPAEAAPHEDA